MNEKTSIYLPAAGNQFKHLKEKVPLKSQDILIIGPNTEDIAKMFLAAEAGSGTIIIDEYDSLIKTRYLLQNEKMVSVRFMEFNSTDFKDAAFDIIYAQASISTPQRNKILKEIKRILKPDGYLSVGEITFLNEPVPKFVNDIRESSNVLALNSDKLIDYYKERKFKVVDALDLSVHLEDFYLDSKKLLDNKMDTLSENEKAYYKKLLNRMSHESNAYLKLGGKDYMGFTSIIAGKET
jgi:SAM-dependent methyltransferase